MAALPWSDIMGEEGVRKPRDGELLGPHNDMEGTDSGERHCGPDTLHREILKPAGSERIHFTKIKWEYCLIHIYEDIRDKQKHIGLYIELHFIHIYHVKDWHDEEM